MFIKNFDYLSPEITLYYNGNESHASIFSGILTLFYYLILISFAGYFSLDIIQKKNPKTFYFNSFIEDAGIYSINSSSFFHFINIEQKGKIFIELGFDFTKFRVIGFQTNFESYIYSKNATYFDHWLYGKCNNEKYKNIKNYDFFENSACISKYFSFQKQKYYNIEDPEFKWPIIAHGTSNQNNTFYSIIIEKCKDDSLNSVLEEEYKCSNNDTEFENYVNSELPKTLNLYFTDNYINILDYKNPYYTFFNKIENLIENKKYSLNNLYFNPSIVKTNDGLLFDNNIENISYIFQRNDEIIRDKEGNDIYMGCNFYLKNMNNLYERSYEKIQDVISDIGGLNDIIKIIFFYINLLINKYISLLDIKLILDSSISTEKNQNNNSNIKNRMKDLKRNLSVDINENKNNFHRYKYISTNLENKKEKKFTLTNISKKNIYNKEEHIDKFKNINKIRVKKLPSSKINKYERNQLFEMPGDANTKDILYHIKEEIEGEYKNIKENMNKNKDNCKNVKNNINFNIWNYILYKITCEKKSKVVKIYDNFRLKILSEEHLVKNYLNTYNLLEITNKRQALD